jgi:hypothetical protein
MRHIDYGLGVLDAMALDGVPEDEPHDLATIYRDLLLRGQLVGFEVHERFYEVGSASGLEETRRFLAGARSCTAEEPTVAEPCVTAPRRAR